jgi:CheY-like chemotaxis protein
MSKQRILIVDDEPSARSGLAELVSKWNFRTDSAENGEKALALIPELDPAVGLRFTPVIGDGSHDAWWDGE